MKCIFVVIILWLGIVESFQLNNQIINGDIASKKQYPFTVALQRINVLGEFQWAAGVIISEHWILTTAQPLKNIMAVGVYLGVLNLTNIWETGQKIMDIPKSKIKLHEKYDESSLENDIALLGVPYPIKYSDIIQPIKITMKNDYYLRTDCEYGILTGWGVTDKSQGTVASEVLRWMERRLVPTKKCRRLSGNPVTSSHICLDTRNGAVLCNQELGSPLILPGETPYLIGLFSFGAKNNCGSGGPIIFTRVEFYIDWIENHTGIQIVNPK